MPVFEYKCRKCGRFTDFILPHSGKKQLLCPHCGSNDLQRQWSRFNVAVKQGNSKRCNTCTDRTCPHSML